MAEELRKWIVPLAVAGAVGVGAYVIYETFVGPRKYWEEQWKIVFESYVVEYKEYTEKTKGALTEAQEKALEEKRKKLREIEENLMSVTGQLWDKVVYPLVITVGIAIILKYFPYEKVGRAIRYYRENATRVYSAEGVVALARNTINVAYADMGMISIATAAQTSTEMWASTMLYPSMQATITALTAQLPLLTGFQLMMTQYLINALQVQMTSTIPMLLSIASRMIMI